MPYTPLPFGGPQGQSILGSGGGGYQPLPFNPGGSGGYFGSYRPQSSGEYLAQQGPIQNPVSGRGAGHGTEGGPMGAGAGQGMSPNWNPDLLAGGGLTWRDLPAALGAIGAIMGGPMGIPLMVANSKIGDRWGPLGSAASSALAGLAGGNIPGAIGAGVDSLGNSSLGYLQDGRQGGFWDFLLGRGGGDPLAGGSSFEDPFAAVNRWNNPGQEVDYGSTPMSPSDIIPPAISNWDHWGAFDRGVSNQADPSHWGSWGWGNQEGVYGVYDQSAFNTWDPQASWAQPG